MIKRENIQITKIKNERGDADYQHWLMKKYKICTGLKQGVLINNKNFPSKKKSPGAYGFVNEF